ncbi:MAG: S8 family serine peptidase, partial [Bacteroidota bacterium]
RIELGQPFDGGQQGTHVCGTIAGGTTPDGVAIGVAPEANLLVGNVLSGEATLRTIIEGIAWAVEKGADIINMSLGMTYYEPKFEEFFDLLLNQYSILPVVAIGNENHGNTSSPGSAFSALSVGAAEQTGRGPRRLGIAPFSSGASLVFPGALEKAMVTKPDVVAPGASVYSCIPALPGKMEYAYMDGTSMATPHVAGVAALLMAAYPEASAVDIATALRETSWHPRGNMLRPDNRWGHGMVEPMKAFQFLSTLT